MPISVKSGKPAEERQFDTAQRQRETTIRNRIADYDAALNRLENQWSGLTTAQRTDAIRDMLILVAKALRWLIAREFRE